MTLLMHTARERCFEILKFLIEKKGADPNQLTKVLSILVNLFYRLIDPILSEW